MKKYIIIVLAAYLAFALTACAKAADMPEPPKITVTVGGREIGYKIGIYRWNGTNYDRGNTFSEIMNADSEIEIPYIQLGENIEIDFKGKSPEKYELRDYVLKDSGSLKYSDRVTGIVPIDFENETASITLKANMAAMLSSHSKDYEKGATIRGFQLICSWADNRCEYMFVIRSDAH